MRKKILAMLLCLVTALGCAFGFTACGGGGDNTGDGGNGGNKTEQTTPTEKPEEGDKKPEQTEKPGNNDDKTEDNKTPEGDKKPDGSDDDKTDDDTTPVVTVTINKLTLTLNAGDTEILIATVTPDNATNKTVMWTSNKPEIASVDDSGKVTAKAYGTAIITATADGKSDTCTVTINAPAPSVFTNKTYVFDRFDNKDLSSEFVEQITTGWKDCYIAFGEEYSVKVVGGFSCGDNAYYQQIDDKIRICNYLDGYPSLYREFEYKNDELVLNVSYDGYSGSYIFVLQTTD